MSDTVLDAGDTPVGQNELISHGPILLLSFLSSFTHSSRISVLIITNNCAEH